GSTIALFLSSSGPHTSFSRDWSSDVRSSDLVVVTNALADDGIYTLDVRTRQSRSRHLSKSERLKGIHGRGRRLPRQSRQRRRDRSEERRVGKECSVPAPRRRSY